MSAIQSDEMLQLSVMLAAADEMDAVETRMWANAQRDGRPAEYR